MTFTQTQQRIIDKAIALLETRLLNNDVLSSPQLVRRYCQLQLAREPDEHFGVIFLISQHHAITFQRLFQGTIDGAAVYPRVVLRRCLEMNAAAVIFVHNHPSGVSEPSPADTRITERLREALALIDVRVLDHVIVTPGGFTSFAETGRL